MAGCHRIFGAIEIVKDFLLVYYLENHHLVFVRSGFPNARVYRYWDEKTRAIDFDGLIEDLRSAPADSVVLLHACAHNPTGIDPTHEQWEKIADVMEVRRPVTPPEPLYRIP